MHRRFLLILLTAFLMSLCTDCFAGESSLLAQGEHDIDRGPGGYLSWIKLLLIAMGYLAWIKMTDWMNRDGQKFGKDIGLPPELWNVLSLVGFIFGFWAALSIPIFLVGYPVMLLIGFLPFSIYFLIRRAKIIETPSLKNRLSDDPATAAALPQDDGAAIKFTPAGNSKEDKQKNLIKARRSEFFIDMKQLLHEGTKKRAESVMLDYTRDQVVSRMMIDGAWHPMDPMTREIGDSVLSSLKNMAGLNPADRRNRQVGIFNAAIADKKLAFEIMTQGTKTGERVQIKFIEKRKHDLTLPQLGMWPEMIEKLAQHTSKPGLVLVSAPPRNGLTTTWRAVLGASDRITRDWIAIVDKNDFETEVENVIVHKYAKGTENIDPILKKLLLSQPDALVVPDVSDPALLDKLVEEGNRQDRTVVTRNQAKSAAESLLRMYSVAGEKRLFSQTIQCVLGQRLARRLCDKCKVPIQVQPQMIQKLGGDPRKTNKIYNAYKLPPVEQRIDENGKPIEMFPCKLCGGIGYIGRISIFEMINVTPQIREALVKQPQISVIRKLATEAGDTPMLQQGYKLVLMGITTVSEVQRVMKD